MQIRCFIWSSICSFVYVIILKILSFKERIDRTKASLDLENEKTIPLPPKYDKPLFGIRTIIFECLQDNPEACPSFARYFRTLEDDFLRGRNITVLTDEKGD
eukprot:TRINITY_DN4328_c0_g1_i1.p1 TRINITY_DN4328_c0_g1~~TRINITY_DN4328_c0_g1_i1.p1  ORF type:complete len:102 (-),score=27.59 TRINITY_DN4328_c0_g1_i1:1389-1694(-)